MKLSRGKVPKVAETAPAKAAVVPEPKTDTFEEAPAEGAEDVKKKNSKKNKVVRVTDFTRPLSDLSAQYSSKEGNHFSLAKISALEARSRQPFGSAVLDYISGGGSPLYTVSSVWGAESAGKSSLLLDQAAAAQSMCWRCMYPYKYCKCSVAPALRDVTWIGIEGLPDESWAEAIGVDLDRLYISLPESAEHGFDVVNDALGHDTCLVVLDSISMASPEDEADSSAEKQFMALQPRVIGRFLRTTQNTLNRRIRANAPVSVQLVNQMRFKIGVQYGSPETFSGGSALRHTNNLLVRVSEVALNDGLALDKSLKTANPKHPNLGVRTNVSVVKRKFFTLGKSDSFVRLTANSPDFPGINPGTILDAGPTIKVALACKTIEKVKSGYKFTFLDRIFSTKNELEIFIMSDRQNKMLIVQESVMAAYKAYKLGNAAPDVRFGPEDK